MNSYLLAAIDNAVMHNVLMAFSIMMVVACVAIIVIIMLQKGTPDNVSAVTGSTETFYGKNKAKDKEGILKKITLGLFVFIIICAIICFVVGIRA